nr:DUF3274 domain-containing protein [Pseudomonas viridiflava]
MWTKRHRDGEPVLVGKTPQPEFLRAAGESRYPGGSFFTGLVSQAPVSEGQERLINAEALNPPHAPEMFGGEAERGTPTTSGLDRPDEVGKSIALGKDDAKFLWIKMPADYNPYDIDKEQALARFNGLSDDREKHQTTDVALNGRKHPKKCVTVYRSIKVNGSQTPITRVYCVAPRIIAG